MLPTRRKRVWRWIHARRDHTRRRWPFAKDAFGYLRNRVCAIAEKSFEFSFRLCELNFGSVEPTRSACSRGSRQSFQGFKGHAGHSDQENWSDTIPDVCHA